MVKKYLCVCAGVALSAWQFVACSRTTEHKGNPGSAVTAAYQTVHRKIFKLSVIPGGVYSADELARARRVDGVVAEHYADFSESAHLARVPEDEFVYVSFRQSNKVFWSKTKHRIPKGELVLTDGKNTCRARCGNRLSKLPHLPIPNVEPSESALNGTIPPDVEIASGPYSPLFNDLPAPGAFPRASTGASPVEGTSPAPTTTGASPGFGPPVLPYPAIVPLSAAGPLLAALSTPGSPVGGTGTTTPTPTAPVVTAVPEPALLSLAFAGLLFLGAIRRKPNQ